MKEWQNKNFVLLFFLDTCTYFPAVRMFFKLYNIKTKFETMKTNWKCFTYKLNPIFYQDIPYKHNGQRQLMQNAYVDKKKMDKIWLNFKYSNRIIASSILLWAGYSVHSILLILKEMTNYYIEKTILNIAWFILVIIICDWN